MKDDHGAQLRARDAHNPPGISAEDVAAYLAAHPDFFKRHEQSLLDLDLPHRAGAAVSLVERQVSLLRERNIDSRQRLSRLMETARDNDLLFSRTRRLVLGLLEADSLEACSRVVLDALRRDFAIDHGRLHLFTGGALIWPDTASILDRAQAGSVLNGLLSVGRPIVGPLRPQERAILFGEFADEVQSAAVVPIGNPACIAVLAAGSSDPRRFHAEMGTMFLEFIGEVLARLLPHHARRG
jgi:uncharacterized protein YigA (DUF484 family)